MREVFVTDHPEDTICGESLAKDPDKTDRKGFGSSSSPGDPHPCPE
jgi:hypothetical protein